MKDDEFERLDAKYVSTIQLYIEDNIVNNVINEEDYVADL